MHIINAIITFLFDLLMLPFRGLPAVAGLTFLSAVLGALMLLVFKKTSNQKGIRDARDHIQGHLMEIRLFARDPVISLRAAVLTLVDNVYYLRYMLSPMLVMAIPVILFLIQAEAYHGVRPAMPGEPVVAGVEFAADAPGGIMDTVSLEAANGLKIETKPMRIRALHEVDWRISASSPGYYVLKFRMGGDVVEKGFRISSDVESAWPARTGGGFVAQALNPGESPVGGSSHVKEIRLRYPDRVLVIAGHDVHWMVYLFVVSIIFGFVLKPFFKVEM